LNPLQAGDVPDRTDCRTADLTNSLGDVIGHGEQLVPMIIK
jgi:hypothetical protein